MSGLEVASFTDAWIETHPYQKRYQYSSVASFTDAWIETFQTDRPALTPKVASFTDAWIETNWQNDTDTNFTSHLLQMRGLKLLGPVDAKIAPVASFTDAWIETLLRILRIYLRSKSHLLQMRGLKLWIAYFCRMLNSRIFYRCVD